MGRNENLNSDSVGRPQGGLGAARIDMLERGINILQAFRSTGEPLRLSEIARRADLPKATTHRLLAELTRLDLLAPVEGGYVLGIGVFELGELVPIKMRLRDTALPYMQDLYAATHETIHLGVRDGQDVLYAEKIWGHSGVDVPSRVGGRLPLSSTGLGKTLLAFSAPEVIAEVLGRPLRTLTARSIRDPAVLESDLDAIRRTGIGYDHEEASPGVSCVAAPVIVRGEAVAAISVSVPSNRRQIGRLGPAVRIVALGLARQLSKGINVL